MGPKHKFNSDRLRIIDQIFAETQDAQLGITREQVENCIEDFEALIANKLRAYKGIDYRWKIPTVCELFVENNHSGRVKQNILMSKTFNEIVVSLYKK